MEFVGEIKGSISDVKGIQLGYENTEWLYIPVKYIKELVITDLMYDSLGYNHVGVFKIVIDKKARKEIPYVEFADRYKDLFDRIEKYKNLYDVSVIHDDKDRWGEDGKGHCKNEGEQLLVNWFDDEPYDYDNYSEKVAYTKDGDLILTITKQADNLAILDL